MNYNQQGSIDQHQEGAYTFPPLKVETRRGLHARPSMELASMFNERCRGGVYVARADKPGYWFDATSVCQLMLLGAGQGVDLRFSFDHCEDASPKLLEDLTWMLQTGTGNDLI